MSVQILEHNGEPAFVVMPIEEYQKLCMPREDAADAATIERMSSAVASGHEETFPAELVNALIDGGNPVRLFREYRQISPANLAEVCGVSRAHIYQIESGKRAMSIELLRKLVTALRVDADLLI